MEDLNTLRLVIVGDGGVGKSSVTMALLRREVSLDYDPTIEDSYSTRMTVDGREFLVEITDTAGQEEYRGAWSEGPARDGDGFLLTYAIDSQTSFDLLPSFLHTIRKVKSAYDHPQAVDTPENTPFPFLVLANKCDKNSERKIPAQQGLAWAKSAGGLFTECSAQLGVNIDSAFHSIIRAAARSKAAKLEWAKTHKNDLTGFNGNAAILERATAAVMTDRGSRRASVGPRGEDMAEKLPPRKKNPNLALDRNKSKSIGGLGRDPNSHGKTKCCEIM